MAVDGPSRTSRPEFMLEQNGRTQVAYCIALPESGTAQPGFTMQRRAVGEPDFERFVTPSDNGVRALSRCPKICPKRSHVSPLSLRFPRVQYATNVDAVSSRRCSQSRRVFPRSVLEGAETEGGDRTAGLPDGREGSTGSGCSRN